jgi:PilZ domain
MTTPESGRVRVYTRAREPFLSYEVIVVDTIREPLKKSFGELLKQTGIGLWLKPYRGIPAIPGLPTLDLIYLDGDDRVAGDVDSYPSLNLKPLNPEVASALVLPAHTVFASQVRHGDQLMSWPAGDPDEVEHGQGLVSERGGAGLDAQSAMAGAGGSGDREALGASSGDGLRRLRQVVEEMEGAFAFRGQKKESVTARLKRWVIPDPEFYRHRAIRVPLPEVVAYRGAGEERQAYCIGNISRTGLYLLTEERPLPGSTVEITLQRRAEGAKSAADPIRVQSKVARWGVDGVGLAFIQ